MAAESQDVKADIAQKGIAEERQVVATDTDAPPDYTAGTSATVVHGEDQNLPEDVSGDAKLLVRIKFQMCKVRVAKNKPTVGHFRPKSMHSTVGDIVRLSELSSRNYAQLIDFLRERLKLLGLHDPPLSDGRRQVFLLRMGHDGDSTPWSGVNMHEANWGEVQTVLRNDQSAFLEFRFGHVAGSAPKTDANSAATAGGEKEGVSKDEKATKEKCVIQ